MSANRLLVSRRTILRLAPVVVGLGDAAGLADAQTAPLRRTPDQILGPFYPLSLKPDTSGDLTRLPGHAERAKGQLMLVSGRVLTPAGEPIAGATIEVWQANAAGRYAHPNDTNPAPLDPNFEGFGRFTSDAEGRYRFLTVKPAAYPTGPDSFRPAHIHFQVQARRDRLVTQLYFEGDPYNDKDRYQQSARHPERLIARIQPAAPQQPSGAAFDLVLNG
jgi:protocatechuate 3,4-dioxygenase beta subunit